MLGVIMFRIVSLSRRI